MISYWKVANLASLFLGRAGVIIAAILASALTVAGEESGRATAVALYAPRPQLPDVALKKRLAGRGLFLSHVRPDGRVSRVDVLRSTGHAELDNAVVSAFKRWRFTPGTVKEVRTPVTFTGRYAPPR
jgi:TonB family protein